MTIAGPAMISWASMASRRCSRTLLRARRFRQTALSRLKKDLDGIADSYDSVRLYQYPVEGTLAITILKEKKWRRLIVKT